MKTNGFEIPFKQISFIWWLDAYVSTDAEPQHRKDDEHQTISFGVVVRETKEFVYMSHFFDGVSHSFQEPWTAIPKGMIKHRLDVSTNGKVLDDGRKNQRNTKRPTRHKKTSSR